MEIAYTAHTETCTLLLDTEGICRSVQAASSASSRGRPARIPSSAEKCIGAQFVACIDLREAGGMIPLPKPGAQMLFARTEKTGRITLVRSSPVVTFIAHATAQAVESGVHERPPPVVSYGPDDEMTIPIEEEPTVKTKSGSVPALLAEAAAEQSRRSSLPPSRHSGVVPAGTAARATIPPPPPAPKGPRPARAAYTPPPPAAPPSDLSVTAPRRPSVRATAPSLSRGTTPGWPPPAPSVSDAAPTQPFRRAAVMAADAPTQPFKRVARR